MLHAYAYASTFEKLIPLIVFGAVFIFLTATNWKLTGKEDINDILLNCFFGLFCAVLTFLYVNVECISNNGFPNHVVKYSEPVVVNEIRYDILGGDDATRVAGSVDGNLFYVSGSVGQEPYYKFYYKDKNDNGEAIVKSLSINEIALQNSIILVPDDSIDTDYVICCEMSKTKYVYFSPNPISEPENLILEEESQISYNQYKMYVRESSFSNRVTLNGE